jgi:hypothetical protein
VGGGVDAIVTVIGAELAMSAVVPTAETQVTVSV